MMTAKAAAQIAGWIKPEPLRNPVKSIFHLHKSQLGGSVNTTESFSRVNLPRLIAAWNQMVVRLSVDQEAVMDRTSGMSVADRFATYVGELTKVVGHVDRAGPPRDYCSGLLATEGSHSVEPMAAVTAPARVSTPHHKLMHLVSNWDV